MANPLDDTFYKSSYLDAPSYHDNQGGIDESPRYDQGRRYFHVADLDKVQRRLGQRHAQMIAIAGTIGTGLFIGSGKAIQRAGPLGTLLAYAHVSTVAYATLAAVGELTGFLPVSGTFPHYAARFVDPAFGFAVGWNYFYTNLLTVPVEVTASQIILTFWDSDPGRQVLYTSLLIFFTVFINIFGVRVFGETEFVLAITKILLIIGLIIMGLVIDLGGAPDRDRRGFRYWQKPGAVNEYLEEGDTGRFLAIIGVIVQAAFTFQGVELVAVAAAETESPRRNIAKAVRRVFWKILGLYMFSILIIGMIVPSDDERLLRETGNASQSPFVIAMSIAGMQGIPHLVNALIFTAAFSAGNAFLYSASRVLYGLSLRGQAPLIFSHCTDSGLPLISILFCSTFSLLSYMTLNTSAAEVFNWFVNLTTIGGFFAWLSINVTYLAFWKGMEAQNIDRKQLVYWNKFQPWLSIWGIFWCALFIVINGFDIFWNFNVSDFLTAYINIPIFLCLYFGFKFWAKTSIWRSDEIDFVTGVPPLDETETPEIPPNGWLEKFADAVF